MTGQISLGFTPGNVVIVTGAGSGIGRATARNAAAVGLAVAAWDMNAGGVAQTVRDIEDAGGQAVAVTADVTSDAQVAAALGASGAARYLVNNAGPASGGASLEFDEAVAMGLGSMRRVTAAWLDGGTQAGAALVNVASVAGNVVGTSPDWYPAAKAGITGYTRHLATYRSDRVRANAVAPGMTDTPGWPASPPATSARRSCPVSRCTASARRTRSPGRSCSCCPRLPPTSTVSFSSPTAAGPSRSSERAR